MRLIVGSSWKLWAIVVALQATNAIAQTFVSGSINADTLWRAALGPYVVSSNITIEGGATLTVEPGVTVYMTPNTSVTIESGAIRALGSAASPIRVLSDKTRQGATAAPGDWNQWIFSPGTTQTRLEYVLFEHGKGLVIQGSAPVFNQVDIRNHLASAMAIDLAASPSGVGNRASGNTLNAIAVPAGDVIGSVRWGLRGIPYLVGAGTVSIGTSPAITSISPATAEQGQTLTLTVSGTRLDGVAAASFDQPGLSLQMLPGGSATQALLQLRVDAGATTGVAALRLQLDAGQVVLGNALTVTAPLPAITSLVPSVVLAYSGQTDITVTGRNFTTASQVLINSAPVSTAFISATQMRATLPNQSAAAMLQVQVRNPAAAQPGEYLLSNVAALTVQLPAPPTVAVEPTPIALPPDNRPRAVTVRLSKADYRDNTLTFVMSDPAKATVSPASAVIPAGQTTTTLTITPKATGTTTLTVDSTTLQKITVPVFVTADFRGANTSYSPMVGVVVQSDAVPDRTPVTAATATVGVAVGAMLTGASPAAWTPGTTPTLTVQGVNIPAGAQLLLVPATGVTLGAVAVNGTGTQLTATLATAADAPVGARRLVVRDAAGRDIVFADPAASAVQILAGLPAIESVDPIFGTRGTTQQLTVRGTNLQQARVRLLPEAGLRVDAAPVVAADGTSLTFLVEIANDAPLGSKVVQITTPAGATEANLLARNAFSVVSAVRQLVTPVASGLVGVLVGSATPQPQTVASTAASPAVGVVVGASVSEVAPNVGVVGGPVAVSVRGAGLQAVTTVSILPSTGLTVGAPSVNAAGDTLSFTVNVDAAAVTGPRRLLLSSATGAVPFVRPTDASFLISAPVPELTAVAPQVLLAGQGGIAMTVRGRNFTNVSAVRIEPGAGITVSGPFAASADGTQLTFTVSVAAGAASGVRAVVVTTAAGESGAAPQAGNMVRIASQVGPTIANLSSAQVGVVNGSAPPASYDDPRTVLSRLVGVMVGAAPGPESVSTHAVSTAVGVIVGPAAQAMTPGGWLQGAAGSIVVSGRGLDAVTAASVTPSTGLVLGAPVISGGGTQLSLSLQVAADAPLVMRQLRLATASGAAVSFVDPATATFGIGQLPAITSVSPIVFEQGKAVTLVVRGSRLKGVTRVFFEPASGLSSVDGPVWSQDGFGELLTQQVLVGAAATLGQRVVRLEVPGGATPATATSANAITVVPPQ